MSKTNSTPAPVPATKVRFSVTVHVFMPARFVGNDRIFPVTKETPTFTSKDGWVSALDVNTTAPKGTRALHLTTPPLNGEAGLKEAFSCLEDLQDVGMVYTPQSGVTVNVYTPTTAHADYISRWGNVLALLNGPTGTPGLSEPGWNKFGTMSVNFDGPVTPEHVTYLIFAVTGVVSSAHNTPEIVPNGSPVNDLVNVLAVKANRPVESMGRHSHGRRDFRDYFTRINRAS